MPTLVIFVALAILLAILLTIIVLMPWLRVDKSAQNDQLIALNVEVFRERLEELKADFNTGSLSESEFKTQKTELERQLLLASEDKNSVVLNDSNRRNRNNSNSDQPVDVKVTDSKVADSEVNRALREQRFTRSLKARLTVLICVPLLMILGYFLSGDRTSVMNLWQAQDTVGEVADDLLTGKIDFPPEWATEDTVGLMGAIQTNVHHHAHDPQRWMRLADILLAFEANEQALEAQSRAYRLAPDDESIAVSYAQTKFFTNGGVLDASSRKALLNVLQTDPNHQGAQMLMAMGEARDGNYDQSQAWVNRLRKGIAARDGDNTEALNSLDQLSQNIAEQKQASLTANNADSGQMTSSPVAVKVTLNRSLVPLVESTDLLFVTIQEATGGAPLAVKRLPAADLAKAVDGFNIELGDEDAMMPTNTLSKAMQQGKPLVIKARISKSGQAMTESGDLKADDLVLDYDNQQPDELKVTIEINQQVP